MLADWFLGFGLFVFRIGFGFGLFSFADTKMGKNERLWKFFRRRGGFARRRSCLLDGGISDIDVSRVRMAAGGGSQKKAAPGWGAAAKICQGQQRSFSGFKREFGFKFFPGSTLAFF